MSKRIQAIRGMNDCLPEDTAAWQLVENALRQVTASYGYSEIRTPIVESTDLFKRSIGEVTDIVEKEMYTFDDRNGDSLTLRPEGTASCVRAGNEHGLLYNQEQRLWYLGPMFRHERPQKGRYRQFHQFGVETYGLASADADAEVIILSARIWKLLGVEHALELEINSLGSNEARAAYKAALVEYLSAFVDQLDEDSKRRLHTNPLRILDSKNPQVQEVLKDAPVLSEHMDEESKQHFTNLCERLDAVGIKYRVNEKLVRGLDYYNRTVFEWVTQELGAQGTVCAGGRYDGLVEQLGGKATPAVGFAMGMERLILLIQSVNEEALQSDAVDVYMIASSTQAEHASVKLAERIRDQWPELKVMSHCGGGNFKKQFKKADKVNASIALIIGEQEVIDQTVAVKYLKIHQEQKTISQEEVLAVIKDLVIGE